MFCYQCEQTSKGEGCTKIGVCGKTADVAALQDLLIYRLKGLSLVADEARQHKLDLAEVNRFTLQATFSTLTNVDFDPARFVALIGQCVALREELKRKVKQAGGKAEFGHEAAAFAPAASVEALVAQGEKTGRRQGAGGRCRCPGAAGTSDLRHQRSGGLCRPRLDPGQEGRERLHLHPRGPGRHAEPSPGRERLPGPGAQVRRGEPESHGAPGRGQHRRLRTPDADQGPAGPEAGQGHPGIRPRPEGPGGDPEAERRQGHQRLHPRRDAALPRVSRAEAEVSPFLRPLRHGLAEPGQGVRQVPRGDPHDHQLHPETHRHLPGQHLHRRPGGLARCAAHRRQQLQAGHRQGPGAAPASPRMPPARRSWSALGATP